MNEVSQLIVESLYIKNVRLIYSRKFQNKFPEFFMKIIGKTTCVLAICRGIDPGSFEVAVCDVGLVCLER